MTSISSVSSSTYLASIAQSLLKSADANSDGKVSTTEFSDMLKTLLSSSSSIDTSKLIAKIDTNGDGEISKDELTAFLESNKPKHAPPPPPPDISMLMGAIMNSSSDQSSSSATNAATTTTSTVV